MNINSHNTVKYFILKLQKILYDANYNNLLQNFCQISIIFDLFLRFSVRFPSIMISFSNFLSDFEKFKKYSTKKIL